MASVVPKEFEGMLEWLLHVTGDRSDYGSPGKVVWASRHIMQRVLERFSKDRLGELEKIISEGLANPLRSHDVDGEFQYWACQKIAGGLNVETFKAARECQYKRIGNLEIPPGRIEFVRALPKVSEAVQMPGVLVYSKQTNEPLCDAAMVLGNELLLFQMTIGRDHEFKLRVWNEYCKEVKASGLAKLRFFFVVPFLENFCVKQEQIKVFETLINGMQVSLEVLEIKPVLRSAWSH